MHIYIAKNGTQTGPFSEEQLREMLIERHVSPNDNAWHEGLISWQPLHVLLALHETPPVPTTHPSLITPPTIPQPVGPTGIGGWLIFFCIGLTILSPLFVLSSIVGTWSQAGPLFAEFPALKTVIVWENFGSIALLIYGFIVGCIIWSGNPRGRSIARKFLLIRLFSFIGIELVALLIMSGLPSEMVVGGIGGSLGAIFQSVVYFLIWWFYFKISKRVKNTYGHEPS